MADIIRLAAGNKNGMPKLADREPAYVRDEEALYVGTPEGNVKIGGKLEAAVSELAKQIGGDVPADRVKFSDGDTFQEKYASGELTGPRGENGAPGAAGAKGDPGAQGEPGADGKSAYSYAQDGGYTGTEADFCTALADIKQMQTDLATLKVVVASLQQLALTATDKTTGVTYAITIDNGKLILEEI